MLFTLKQNIFLLLASSILATATAQDSSAQDDLPTSSAPPDPSPYPTATIFLPGSLHELPGGGRNLAASVITANENQTAYAIGCLSIAANSSAPGPQGCHLQSTITVTGGESTLIYTYNPIVTTDNGMPGTSIPPPPSTSHSGATINCNMAGGTRATAATCTGSSQIEGLGRVGSSTTLASTQINYATLTVTAGRAMLASASEAAAQASNGESSGEGSGDKNAASSLGELCWGVYGWVVLVVGLLGVGVL